MTTEVKKQEEPEIVNIPSSNRALATIRRVAEKRPIEGADRIEAVRIDGWWVVSQKNLYEVGDLVVYFEIDSWIPHEIAPFLTREGKEPKDYNGVPGQRLKTIRLRGQLSQGLILPLTDVKLANAKEGDNVTEALNIQLWEKPVPAQLRGQVKGSFPTHIIPKTDQERIQNIPKILEDQDTAYEITVKYDGTSLTVFFSEELGPGICSRNIRFKVNEQNKQNNLYVKTALNTGLYDAVVQYYELTGRQIAVQAEIVGPKIQDNRMHFEDTKVIVFDIWDINKQEYLLPLDRLMTILTLQDFFNAWIYLAEVFENYKPLTSYNLRNLQIKTVEDIIAFAEKPKDFNQDFEGMAPYRKDDCILEGFVFKAFDGSKSFKVINNNYLLKYGG